LKNTDKAEFAKVVIGFAELKGKVLSRPAIELYWLAMQDWSIEDFKAAAAHLLRTCTFMPEPKNFEDLRKAGRDTAGEAWIAARRYLRWGLHSHTLDESCPPLIARAVHAIGGPNVIAMCDEDKLTFLEKRFVEHYADIQDSEEVREAVPQIARQPDRLALKLAETQKRLTGS
jgi:hypothetical protein